jgi:ABC-type glutathione transport system ATPase component
MLEVQNISKSFSGDNLPAVHDVSFRVAAGELLYA